jgi:hypothetical protein
MPLVFPSITEKFSILTLKICSLACSPGYSR